MSAAAWFSGSLPAPVDGNVGHPRSSVTTDTISGVESALAPSIGSKLARVRGLQPPGQERGTPLDISDGKRGRSSDAPLPPMTFASPLIDMAIEKPLHAL